MREGEDKWRMNWGAYFSLSRSFGSSFWGPGLLYGSAGPSRSTSEWARSWESREACLWRCLCLLWSAARLAVCFNTLTQVEHQQTLDMELCLHTLSLRSMNSFTQTWTCTEWFSRSLCAFFTYSCVLLPLHLRIELDLGHSEPLEHHLRFYFFLAYQKVHWMLNRR